MSRIVLFVVLVTIWTTVHAGEQCGIFSCPRPFIDDSDDKYCCGNNNCCDDCWRSTVDTSACVSVDVGRLFRLGIGAIVGIIVGALILLAIIIAAIVCCCCACAKGSSRRNQPQAVQMAPVAQPVQYPPGQYPQYPPAQPPAYPQYSAPPAYPQNPPGAAPAYPSKI